MNCPFHILIYKERPRSYRDLPMRLSEFGAVYRNELSGALHGLTRVRGFTMDDAHLFVRPDQLEQEVAEHPRTGVSACCATSDSPTSTSSCRRATTNHRKWLGRRAMWEETTAALRRVAVASGLDLVDDPGGAAFYGPKISVQARDALGRTWQLSTVQIDPNLPERFELEYTAADGQQAATDHDSPRAPRIDGALLRHPARALRRRVPGLAVARAGRRHPGRRGIRRLPRRHHRSASRPRACAPSSTTPTTACRRRSARTRRPRCRSS